jgi:hypothetical protein
MSKTAIVMLSLRHYLNNPNAKDMHLLCSIYAARLISGKYD